MILKKWSLALVVAALVAPLSANALGINGFSVTSSGGDINTVQSGDILTFELTVDNTTPFPIYGLGIGAWGYDGGAIGDQSDDRLIFLPGSSASSAELFSTGNNGTVGFGGIATSSGPIEVGGVPFPIEIERRVQAFNGVSVTGTTTGTGSEDIGVDGAVGTAQIRLSFVVRALTGVQDVTLTFGIGEFGNDAIGRFGTPLPFGNESHTVTVIPEPGTALLMGLGLAGLATIRRR